MIQKHQITDIVNDHYKYHLTRDERYFWAVSLWWSLDTWEERLEYIISIIKNAPINDHDYLGGIGAGELGDLRDIHILEFITELRTRNIHRDSEFDKKLCIALQIFKMQPCGEPFTNAEKEIIKYIKYHYPSFVNDGNIHTT
jgi:hypothetical protein